MSKTRIGIIGCGGRGTGLVRMLSEMDRQMTLAVVADPNEKGARARLERGEVSTDETLFCRDDEALLERADELDGIIIATRCHLHAPIAVKAAATGLPLYLEKPVAIDEEQLATLAEAFRGREEEVVVSFPLRVAPVFARALEILRSGRLGTVNQVQAYNNVPYGGHYFGGHYRNYGETGGLWLQKATHDFDYLNVLMNSAPEKIAATMTRKIYGGDKPHDLRCSACDETATCMESPPNLRRRGNPGGMNWDDITSDDPDDHWCAFSREIRNQDAGSALILYGNGSHACYTQNFVTRLSAGRRGATITGYAGTLDFSFDGKIRVVEHHRRVTENIEVKETGGHGGGDPELVRSFLGIIRDGTPACSSLTDGIVSCAMSLAARRSAERQTFEDIAVP